MKYELNIEIDDLIGLYSRKWAFTWLEKYHPEVMERAKQELTKLAESCDRDPKKFCNANVEEFFEED